MLQRTPLQPRRLAGLLALLVPAALGADTPAPEVVQMSPFEVNTTTDTSWRAATTLIGNRTNQELAKTPLSDDVITGEFIHDLDLGSLEDAARFVSGLTVLPQFESRTDDNRITYRGLNSASPTTTSRNFFLWYVPVDTYNVERFDFDKGSNSLIFGNSAPGGQATTFTKQPRNYTFAEVLGQYGPYGGHRFQGDFNYALNDRLSLRLNLVDRSNRTYVDSNFQNLDAKDLAVAWHPFKTTTIRVEAEKGTYQRRRGDNALAVLTTAAPGLGFSTSNRWYYTSDGAIVSTASGTTLSTTDRAAAGGSTVSLLQGQNETVSLPGGKTKVFTGFPKSFNVLGTGDYLDRPYSDYGITLQQTFGKLALEAAFNEQVQEQERNDVSFGTTSSPPTVSVDATGRPFVDEDGATIYKIFGTRDKSWRFNATYPFELGKWMKQYLVGSYGRDEDLEQTRRFSLVNTAASGSLTNNVVRVRAYLDSPSVTTGGFWNGLLPTSLPTTANFAPGLDEVYVNTGPVFDLRYSDDASASLTGEYFGGKLRTLIGAGTYRITRKIPVASIYTASSRGTYTLIGSPFDQPDMYTYDPGYDVRASTTTFGLSYSVLEKPAATVNVYGVVSKSFNWQSATTFYGQSLGPITGDTKEVGLKGDLFNQALFYTVAFYQIHRQNAAYQWTPDTLTAAQLEDLFNPNTLQPSDPAYFHVTQGLNNERKTVNSNEASRGCDLTLQSPRLHGVQARVTFSYTDVQATRDFSEFKAMLDQAIARTNAANAPGGNPALAESAALITSAQGILASNVGVTAVTGLRSAPYTASTVIDYEVPGVAGLRLGIDGVWLANYNIAILNGIAYRGGGSLPVGLYAAYARKILHLATTFRVGLDNAYDLVNGRSAYRKTGALSTDASGNPYYLYRYRDPVAANASVTVHF